MEPAGSHHGYADSVGSSPRSRNTDSWEDPPFQSGAGAGKLRLMCSYGGHIVPRPHDKSLCYLGGDTRIVVVDRNSSLADLSAKLGRTLLDGRSFTLKYQLPNEDLDSLISVATDEDLDNMIEEYDRTSTSLKPSRLRLFLFPTKPDSASSIGSLLDDSKSETWFVDALNGAGIGPRGLSADSNSVNSLLGLDYAGPVTGTDTEPARSDKPTRQDVHSVPDSPMLGTTSSFGSASSVPSLSNLPPLRVRVDGRSGLEDQFSQMKTDDGFKDGGFVRDLPNPVVSGPATVGAIGVMSPPAGFGENASRVLLEEERPDLGFERKPSQKTGDLDSAAADARENLDTAIYHQQHIIYQDRIPHIPPQDHTSPGAAVSVPDPKREVANPNYGFPVQVQDPSLMMQMQPKQQQPQFIHAGPHYIQHHAAGSIPIPSYYQMQPVQHSQQHQQVDQQYPMYYVSVRQNPLQKPAPVVNPAVGPPQYKDATPIYPPRSAPPPRPEMYRTAAVVPQQPHIHVQDPHHQYMGYHQAPPNYAYEYMDPTHGQIYYTQPTSTTMASQYQTVTSAAGVAEASMSPPAGPTDSKQN